jgi:hypothetical protein
MTRDEIITLASRYIDSDTEIDFPMKNDVFCLLARDLPENKILTDEEGWGFTGYGICLGYIPDEQVKPVGKWIFMHFASLDSFPPTAQTLKLQPPHIVKGRFQNPERTREIRILKVELTPRPRIEETESEINTPKIAESQKDATEKKIIQFRKKNT